LIMMDPHAHPRLAFVLLAAMLVVIVMAWP
jgi:hypothetical protein